MSSEMPADGDRGAWSAREPVETRLARYNSEHRHNLRNLARRSRALCDLLYSFPAAAMVFAGGGASGARLRVAERLLEEGRPLAEAARALGLAMWLKRLPPEAFRGPPGDLPGDPDFARRIVNHLPDSPWDSASWLSRVTFGIEACGPSFAVWLAQTKFAGQGPEGGRSLIPLAAYAWFSGKEKAQAGRLMAARWCRKTPFASAVRNLNVWLEGLVLGYCATGDSRAGGWRESVVIDNYCFEPLLTQDELNNEGRGMRNCLKQHSAAYAARIASGECLIYSIRRGGVSIANMELRLDYDGKMGIAQLLGENNTPPTSEVRWAAEVWLARRKKHRPPLRQSGGKDPWEQLKIPASRWEKVWAPYLKAKPKYAELLRSPSRDTLIGLRDGARALERWT